MLIDKIDIDSGWTDKFIRYPEGEVARVRLGAAAIFSAVEASDQFSKNHPIVERADIILKFSDYSIESDKLIFDIAKRIHVTGCAILSAFGFGRSDRL